MNLKAQWRRILLAVLLGVAVTTTASISQKHFKAGSIPDLACELVLLPGKLFAILFHDRGSASPEFLWRSRIATTVVLAGVAWFALSVLRRRNQSPVAPRR